MRWTGFQHLCRPYVAAVWSDMAQVWPLWRSPGVCIAFCWHLPGSGEARASVFGGFLLYVPAWCNSLPSSNWVCCSSEKESTLFRAAMSLKWLLLGGLRAMVLGKCSLVDNLAGDYQATQHAGGCVLQQGCCSPSTTAACGAARPALCWERDITPNPLLFCPQELPYGLIPCQSQQAETRAFSRCRTTHSFSVQGYLHFVLHSVLLEQVSPHHL